MGQERMKIWKINLLFCTSVNNEVKKDISRGDDRIKTRQIKALSKDISY